MQINLQVFRRTHLINKSNKNGKNEQQYSEDIAQLFLKDRTKTEKFRTRRLLEYVCMK